ncbi:arginine repressor [Arcanobacterium canis]|uniref:Arginine repressor n=1 Tax=Arcanobacterium canis TaxID=999183 RepID=A0ABY8FZY5_9ACTO|nr:arginine repressor [Arcanobacterium canis]WFM84085.1 arginine repressor [Arcanobacterium canis]
MPNSVPKTRTARQAKIVDIIEHHAVASQAALRLFLSDIGINVTQATLSRDLEELRAYKEYNAEGVRVYKIPDAVELSFADAGAPGQFERWASELMTGAVVALNQVVLRTVPGAAQLLASAIDRAVLVGVLGCIAGDDTVLVITDSPEHAQSLREELLRRVGR